MKRAWHFVGKTLRDGRRIPRNGVWLEEKGEIVICRSGLHASLQPFDALQYAPGATLCLVDVDGIVAEQEDKLVARRRRIVARMDATELMRYFARMQAVSVIHLWDAPEIVCDYLMTGDDSLRDAAWAAAMAAAWDAAWDAARAAARAAAWDAARAAAWAAARDAAWDAAWDAARDAARAAARDAARAAARAAAWDAAWDAARAAAWDAAKNEFNQLVYECFEDYA